MSERRDWLRVASNPAGSAGRVLLKTPHEIAVIIAHRDIVYGRIIEEAHYGYVLSCIKRTIFNSVKGVITENSLPAPPPTGSGSEKE